MRLVCEVVCLAGLILYCEKMRVCVLFICYLAFFRLHVDPSDSVFQVLTPDWSLHRLTLWSSVYLSNNSLKTSSAEEFAASVEQADQVASSFSL